jgi:hypothetical protein
VAPLVERHVSNLLAKVGVRIRTELAVALSEAPRDAPDMPGDLEIEGVPR